MTNPSVDIKLDRTPFAIASVFKVFKNLLKVSCQLESKMSRMYHRYDKVEETHARCMKDPDASSTK
jgi:beta-lactamase class D